jgi:hypothetical protein
MKLLGACLITLCASAMSFGVVTWDSTSGIITYGSPSDLGNGASIDPAGLNDVTNSYGVTKAAFQTLANVQVVGFNPPGGAPAASATLKQLVVNYSATDTITFGFPLASPAGLYNYGSRTTVGRGAFSGSGAGDAFSTVAEINTIGDPNNWFDATITTTGGQGVAALGFCAGLRNDQAVANGHTTGGVLYTLSDGSTARTDLPILGGAGNIEYVFIGYQAPAGLTITRVQAGQITEPAGCTASIADLSFVMTPEPTTMALLALGGLMLVRRRHA